MAAPATELLRELERELELARDENETRSREVLLERVALHEDDLEAAIDMLRTHGKAIEESPGEWRAPYEDETAAIPEPPVADGRVQVSSTAMEEWEPEQLGGPISISDPRHPLYPPGMLLSSQPTVKLTRSIADALDAGALGQLVKAGLADTEAGSTFLLEIVA